MKMMPVENNQDDLPGGYLFTSEIKQMMYGLGDCRQPLVESVQLVERILARGLFGLLWEATETATKRSSHQIGVEDVMFLLRKEQVVIQRLLRALEVKYMNVVSEWEGGSSRIEIASQKKNLLALVRSYLSSLLGRGWEEDIHQLPDPLRLTRLARAEALSRHLGDSQAYLEFAQARQANFHGSKGGTGARFQSWLAGMVEARESSESKLGLSPAAVELLAWLAHQAVTQLMDMVLLVRSDSQNGDQLSRLANQLNPKVGGNMIDVAGVHPVTPGEIHEAVRRWQSQPTPFSAFAKTLTLQSQSLMFF